MLVARGCSKSTFFVVMTLAVLVPQEGVTQDIPEPQSLGRMTPAEAESDKKSDKLAEEFSNEALDATRKLGPIEIDGRIDEPDWEMAKVFTGFTAKEPIEGEPAKDDTEVRVLLGDGAVWIGARMWDSEPEEIVSRLTRRDSDGIFDKFSVHLDPNRDHLTGYIFSLSVANVQRDHYVYDDDKLDGAWDAVWSSAVQRDEDGWSAEIRIPLSQIRYEASGDLQTWGINFYRRRVASAEESYYALLSKLEKGIASRMAELEGVLVDSPSRRFELLPYAVSNYHSAPATPGDPFFDGTATNGRIGLDLSYGLGASFTLDATINPDFGQVEADPAVINLSAFETFQGERRPFFVEDARIFDFTLSGKNNQLFYSRRVGRAPHGRAPYEAEHSQVPENATILGAAKLSGRTAKGLSVGVLGAVTGDEFGQGVFGDGSENKFLVEPRSEVGVLSLAKDFGDGASQVRGLMSGLRRALPSDESYNWLASSAFNGGLRLDHRWRDGKYGMFAYVTGSHVRGAEEAITRIQKASNHYFQRPDATRASLDETATAISGLAWRLNLEKREGEHWTGSVWSSQITNGFEINELGFYPTGERLDVGARINYKEIVPGRLFRGYSFGGWTYHNWSHEALDDLWSSGSWRDARVRGAFTANANGQFLNYWNLRTSGTYTPRAMSRSATRGGPMMMRPGSTKWSVNLSSDRRKAVSFGSHFEMEDDRQGVGGGWTVRSDVKVQPSERLQVVVTPRYNEDNSGHQYVSATETMPYSPTFGVRYLFADLSRRTVSMETRLDWTFTPRLSLQLFAQPLLSSGDYVQYKQLATSKSYDFLEFNPGAGFNTAGGVACPGICDLEGRQYVDFDGDGTADYSFRDRDFNVRSLVGNAVLRWEYRPGSTVFLVWQRRQSDYAFAGNLDLQRDATALFEAPADNRFIIKMNYWLGL